MPTLWLPPKVWFHGSQSTSTGGASPNTGKVCSSICWLAQSMRWVVTTALGSLVEPLVKRNLAMVSGPVRAKATSAAAGSRGPATHRSAAAGAPPRRLAPAAGAPRPVPPPRWRGRRRRRPPPSPGRAAAGRRCAAAWRNHGPPANRPATPGSTARRCSRPPGPAAGAPGRCRRGSPAAAPGSARSPAGGRRCGGCARACRGS